MKKICLIILTMIMLIPAAAAAEAQPGKPGEKERCPVCGMYPAKYQSFMAQVVLKDGSRAYFDGTKDMLKYYQNIGKYSAGKKPADIDAVFVTDYYSVKPVNGRSAFFVKDSDVSGPMGRDLIPFKNKKEAEKFMRDHRGKKILTFSEITPELVKELE